ncbi:MAG: hypothetical protein ABSC92_12445 [Rhizomicrobium sp.]|jgi:hypothetical protein
MRYANAAFVALSIVLGGCVSSGREVTDQEAAQFQKGVTTEADVVAKLGPPNSIVRLADGTSVIAYAHVEASPDAVDFAPIIDLLNGGAPAHATDVSFTFDTNGKLTSYMSSTTDSNLRTGIVD